MKNFIILLLFSSIFFLLGWFGLARYEKVECHQWLLDSQKYNEWYATDWQVEQCKVYDISLD